MLNQCIIQGIVKLGVTNFKMKKKRKYIINIISNLELGYTQIYLLLLKCRSTSDIRGWSLGPGLPYLYLKEIVKPRSTVQDYIFNKF